MEHLLLNRDDTHTLSVYVANKPGVLARIAQVFARRGYNIDSLVVSSSMDGKFSRMTVTAKGNPDGLDQTGWARPVNSPCIQMNCRAFARAFSSVSATWMRWR